MRTTTWVTAVLCVLSVCGSAAAGDPGAPAAFRQTAADTYYGVRVQDPYRWLENPNSAKVREWSAAQNERTRKYLASLPQREPIYKQLLQQISSTSGAYSRLYAAGGQVFARYDQPPKQQPMIAVFAKAIDPAQARVVVDPNILNPKGTTAIDWFVPSPDGKLLAVSLSDNGSEEGTLYVFDVTSGGRTGDSITRVQYPTAGGSLAWRADSKGFWYTRYPGQERPADERRFFQQVFFHRVGDDPGLDNYVLGKGLPKLAEIMLDNRGNANMTVVSVANGDGGDYAHYVIDADGSVRQITHFEDKVVAVTAARDGALYLVSRQNAPRGKLLKLKPGAGDMSRASVLVPESEAVLQGGGEFGGEPLVDTPHALYVRELIGGPSQVAIFDHSGKALGTLPLPAVAAVSEIQPLGDGTLLYAVETYLRPPYFSRYDERTARATESALVQTSAVSFADAEVVRETATSKDGTSVPLSIIRRKGVKLDGSNPLLLTGYGGYDVSLTPKFLGAATRLWLDGGGVFAIANLRGGGEFGETWHEEGALTHKQNVFDDFIASAEYLIGHSYTDRNHLAIEGGSNGGLLMGAVLTQRPELFRAVVSRVGIYDMLRVERDPNGAFNTTEFGSVQDPDQFKALYAYSPYHHVTDGVAYPAIFMATGATDGRVNPAHSRKMAARLQAATGSGKPVFLSINAHAGHGMGSSLSIRVNQSADIYSFLFDQLGMQLRSERHAGTAGFF